MNPGSARIILELTGHEVRAECPKLNPINGQLKAILALLEHHFTAAPVREQRGENERQQCASQDDSFGNKYAGRERDACVSEMPYAHFYRPNYRRSHNKRSCGSEHGPAAHSNP